MRQSNVLVQRADADFDDWQQLHALLVACFRYMDGRIDPPSSLTRMGPEALRAKAGEETLVLAYAGGKLVGCSFLAEKDDAIYIGKVAVAAAYRRRGILGLMIGEAERLARQRSKAFLELQTRIELTENHRTFTRLGFFKTAETTHAGYERPTSVTMRKAVQGHNGGPPLDDHVPPWGRNGIKRYVCWKAARAQAFSVSHATALRRVQKAKACGVTFEEYTSYLLDTGCYLQPSDVDAIEAIKMRRRV